MMNHILKYYLIINYKYIYMIFYCIPKNFSYFISCTRNRKQLLTLLILFGIFNNKHKLTQSYPRSYQDFLCWDFEQYNCHNVMYIVHKLSLCESRICLNFWLKIRFGGVWNFGFSSTSMWEKTQLNHTCNYDFQKFDYTYLILLW